MRIWYVQWVTDPEEVERRLALGWTFAQWRPSHHSFYAVLMQAPEGWEP